MADPNTVINPDSRICETLTGLAAHYRRTWCYPTQETIRELLARFTGRRLSRRTLNRHLRALERDGHIRRIRRHVRDRARGMLLRSTVYVICGRFLARIRRIVTAANRWLDFGREINASSRVPSSAQYRKGSIDLSLRRRL